MKRREMLKALVSTPGIVFATAPMLNRGRYRLFSNTQAEYSARTIELIGRANVIDMMGVFAFTPEREWLARPESFTAADFQRFKEMGVTILNHAPGFPGTGAGGITRYFARWNGFLAHHSDRLLRIDGIASLERVKGTGKLGVLLGLQSSDHFTAVEDVEFFFSLGQRVSQLTYNARNLIGSGSTERRDDGLSDFGVAIVQKMNECGMAVDVSHCGDRTTLDAFEVSRKPVLITHSNARVLNPGHPRCKTDEAIRKMAANGGVMGITMIRMFVSGREPTTLDHAIDHFDHVAKLVGVEHLGVGSDINADAIEPTSEQLQRLKSQYSSSYGFRDKMYIEGLNHSRRVFDLTEGLIRRKYSDESITGILGGNFRRALTQIWPGV